MEDSDEDSKDSEADMAAAIRAKSRCRLSWTALPYCVMFYSSMEQH